MTKKYDEKDIEATLSLIADGASIKAACEASGIPYHIIHWRRIGSKKAKKLARKRARASLPAPVAKKIKTHDEAKNLRRALFSLITQISKQSNIKIRVSFTQ